MSDVGGKFVSKHLGTFQHCTFLSTSHVICTFPFLLIWRTFEDVNPSSVGKFNTTSLNHACLLVIWKRCQ